MGCIQIGKSYFESPIAEEREIRRFEKEIGAFAIDFNQVIQKLSSHSNTINFNTGKRVFEQFFNQSFIKIIDSPSFLAEKSEQKELLGDKVNALIFLLTAQGMIANKYSYYSDKTYYFYQKCKLREEEDLAQGLTKDGEVRAYIKSLVQVACIDFPTTYYKSKNSEQKSIVNEMNINIEGITDYVMNDLFKVKLEALEILSFKELKEKFNSDSFFFSSGYIRGKAYEFLQSLAKK